MILRDLDHRDDDELSSADTSEESTVDSSNDDSDGKFVIGHVLGVQVG